MLSFVAAMHLCVQAWGEELRDFCRDHVKSQYEQTTLIIIKGAANFTISGNTYHFQP